MFKSLFYSTNLSSGGGEGDGVMLYRLLFPLLIPLVEDLGEKFEDPTAPSCWLLLLYEIGLILSSADLSVLSRKYSFSEPNTSFCGFIFDNDTLISRLFFLTPKVTLFLGYGSVT